MELAVGGCERSFSQLAEIFRPRIVQLVRQRLGRQQTIADAEDVAQDTLVKAFLNLSKYNSQYRFSTWMYTIAFRVAYDYVRKQRRWFHLLSKAAVAEESGGNSAKSQFEQRDQVDNVWLVAGELLTPDQYSAFWLRYGEDLSIGDVSQVLGKPEGSIRVLLHRGRMVLIEHFQQQEIDLSPRSGADRSGAAP